MREGMVFTIEPILVEGLIGFHKWNDGWTCESIDGLRSAQFEHTILITEDGCEALTDVYGDF
jgi:methionyl aminopeptidase